jgi:hypothetical protein
MNEFLENDFFALTRKSNILRIKINFARTKIKTPLATTSCHVNVSRFNENTSFNSPDS